MYRCKTYIKIETKKGVHAIKLKQMELNNTVNSTLLNVRTYFRMKKIIVDADKSNICELAKKALEANGITSTIQLDENGSYVIKISKLDKIWNGE